MATKYHKLAALGTSYVSLSVLEPVGFAHKHTVQCNSNWAGVMLSPSQSHLALIGGYYLTDLGEGPVSSGLWVCHTF